MVSNLQKARLSWVLGQEGADPRTSGTFYKAVVQTTLLFGAETWVVFPRIGKTFGGFHHRVDRRLAGMQQRRDTTGGWV